MIKLKLFFTYIVILLAQPKKAAEIVNAAQSVAEMDERMMIL